MSKVWITNVYLFHTQSSLKSVGQHLPFLLQLNSFISLGSSLEFNSSDAECFSPHLLEIRARNKQPDLNNIFYLKIQSNYTAFYMILIAEKLENFLHSVVFKLNQKTKLQSKKSVAVFWRTRANYVINDSDQYTIFSRFISKTEILECSATKMCLFEVARMHRFWEKSTRWWAS